MRHSAALHEDMCATRGFARIAPLLARSPRLVTLDAVNRLLAFAGVSAARPGPAIPEPALLTTLALDHRLSRAPDGGAHVLRDVLRERKADQASRTPLSGALFGALTSNERRSDNIHFKTNECVLLAVFQDKTSSKDVLMLKVENVPKCRRTEQNLTGSF